MKVGPWRYTPIRFVSRDIHSMWFSAQSSTQCYTTLQYGQCCKIWSESRVGTESEFVQYNIYRYNIVLSILVCITSGKSVFLILNLVPGQFKRIVLEEGATPSIILFRVGATPKNSFRFPRRAPNAQFPQLAHWMRCVNTFCQVQSDQLGLLLSRKQPSSRSIYKRNIYECMLSGKPGL